MILATKRAALTTVYEQAKSVPSGPRPPKSATVLWRTGLLPTAKMVSYAVRLVSEFLNQQLIFHGQRLRQYSGFDGCRSSHYQ